MAHSANTDALYRARDRFNAHDAAYFDVYADDVVLHGFPPGVGDRQTVEQFDRAVWGAFPDAELDFEDIFEQDDRLAVRYRLRGTHRGELLGAPGAGNRVDVDGMAMMRMREGRIAERWQALDDLGLVQQIGAIPAPA